VKVCPACGAQYGDDAAFCARDRTPLNAPGKGLIGQLVGDRYQIERKLGEGGMGEVYLARHVMMGRRAAVKVMSPGLLRDPDAAGRFNREATNASRISHPNVCAVYDFGATAEGQLYLAMEYLEGRTLTDALAQGPLPLARAVTILSECAAGLAAAHELGIVHRDLKPDNVMLLDQRGRETVKLVDFGIAKAATGEGAQRVTKTGLVVGTPEYMSPEQLSGDELDGRSDQYSLALVFCRMVTGALPFAATSAQETMVKRLTERPRALAELAPATRFPPALQAVLDRALERKADARFPTIDAFSQAIAAAVSPTQADPTVALPRTEVVAPPRRWRTPLAVGAALTVVAAATIFVQQRTRAGDGTPPTPTALVGAESAGSTVAPPGPAPATSEPASPPATPPAPVPVPPPSPAPAAAAAADTGLADPRDEDFDDPALAPRAAARAKLIADSPRFGRARRANAAFNYGSFLIGRNDREAARRYFQLSCDLVSGPRCTILDQFKDPP